MDSVICHAHVNLLDCHDIFGVSGSVGIGYRQPMAGDVSVSSIGIERYLVYIYIYISV